MSDYQERHGRARASRVKPDCYGDVDYYDPADEICEECHFKSTCRASIRRKQRLARGDGSRSSSSTRREDPRPKSKTTRRPDAPPSPESYEEREEERLGFFGALVANSALSAVRVGLTEAAFAVDQIPRFPYPDPFKKAIDRGRGEEED